MRYYLSISILAMVVLSSCQNTAKLICRPWQVSGVRFNERTSTLSPQQTRAMRYQLTEAFKFQFKPDSGYYVVRFTDTLHGKWYLSADKKVIHTLLDGGEQSAVTILQLNRKVFEFQPQESVVNIEAIVCSPVKNH